MNDWRRIQPWGQIGYLVGISGLLAVVAFGLYAMTLPNPFFAEDFHQSQYERMAGWLSKIAMPGGGEYRPLTYLSWVANNLIWGGTLPFPYRVVMLLRHWLNACLVFSLVRQATRQVAVGLWAALFFLVFLPSANNINWLAAASSQVLCVFGYLLALRAVWPLLANRRPSALTQRRSSLLIGLGLFCAFGSNEMGLTWPVAALYLGGLAWYTHLKPQGVAWWPTCRRQLKTLALWFIAWAVFLGWRTLAVGGIGGYGASVHLRFGWFLIQDFFINLHLFTQPVFLALFKFVGPTLWGWDWNLVIDLLLGVAVVVGGPQLWGPVGLSLITLLPVLNIPGFHRLYLVGAGLAWFFAALFMGRRRQTRLEWGVRQGLALIWFGVLVTGTVALNQSWYTAGMWEKQILAETRRLVPSPADQTHFYYFDLPQSYNDIYTFTWGLREAIQKNYPNYTLDAYQIYQLPNPRRVQLHLEATPETIKQEAAFEQIFLVYQPDPATGQLLRRVTLAEFLQLVTPAP